MDNIIFRLGGLVTPIWLTGMGVEILETYRDGSMAIESTTRLVEVNTAYELYSRTINIPERKDMFRIKEVINNFSFLSVWDDRMRMLYESVDW
ncbi:MAG: hypothetical protein HXP18_00935 [Veillonella sp.]|nr:hypothetical protein [Veillonella sp.]